MSKYAFLTLGVVCCMAVVAFGQATDTPFQVHYASNLNLGDPKITIMNDGANSTIAVPTQDGQICVNVYGFAATTGSMTSCCTCYIQANAIRSLSVWADLLNDSPRVSPTPSTLAVKLLATTGTGGPDGCNAATAGGGSDPLAAGMLAWETEPQPSGFFQSPPEVVKNAFSVATLSSAELSSLQVRCGALHPTAHKCPSCP